MSEAANGVGLERKTLREWRKEAGLTQAELGELAGCVKQHIGGIERGRLPIRSATGHRIAKALGLKVGQIEPVTFDAKEDEWVWAEDGFASSAPRQTLRWWRNRRGCTQEELSMRAGLSATVVNHIELGYMKQVSASTRRKFAKALAVDPAKLILPGDAAPPGPERAVEDLLRAELRGARKALKRAHDFLREDPNIALKALDKRDALLPAIEQELRGT